MIEPASAQDLFKGRHFDQEIIVLCVRWCLTFKLSSRDLVQMMAERGITLAHTTILRWVQRYVPDFEKRWSRYALPVGDSWRVDETLSGRVRRDRGKPEATEGGEAVPVRWTRVATNAGPLWGPVPSAVVHREA
jgi:hypothetical protein